MLWHEAVSCGMVMIMMIEDEDTSARPDVGPGVDLATITVISLCHTHCTLTLSHHTITPLYQYTITPSHYYTLARFTIYLPATFYFD